MKKELKKKHLFIKIIIAVFTLAILSYLTIIYVNRTLIPVKLKNQLEKSLSDYTLREVGIDKLTFSVAKGFVLDGIKVYEGPKDKGQFLLKADKVSFGIIFIPSFKKHRLIIPRVNIDNPYLHLKRLDDGTWNISGIIKKESKEKKPPPVSVSVNSVSFTGGEIYIEDTYRKVSSQKTIKALSGSVGLALPDAVNISCSGKIDEAFIKIISKFKPNKNELSAEIDTKNLPISEYWNEYLAIRSYANSGVDAQDNLWLDNLKIDSGICDGSIKISLSDFQKAKIEGGLSLRDLRVKFNDMTIMGNYKLSGKSQFDTENLANISYDSKLELDNANISTGIKQFKKVDEIKGVLLLSEKLWSTKELHCLLDKAPAIITAMVKSPHKDPTAEIEISSTLILKDISDTVKIDFAKGKAIINTKIDYAHKDKSYKVSGTSKIEDLKLRQKDITISGNFSIDGESKGIIGNWESLEYKGSMNFDKAQIEGMGLLPLVSNASGNAIFSTKHISIREFAGNAADTKISLNGNIEYQKKEPRIDLNLKTSKLSLAKLISTLPEELRSKLKDIDADGICSVDVALSGNMGDLESFTYNGSLSLKGGSAALPYWPNEISNIDCDVLFEKQKVTWKSLGFNIKDTRYHSYGSLADFVQPKISASLKSKDINLMAELNIDKNKTIHISKCSGGYRNSTFLLSGKVSDIKTAFAEISGSAQLNLEDAPYLLKSKKEALEKLKPEGNVKLTFDMRGPIKESADWDLSAEGNSSAIHLWGLEFKDFYLDYRMKDNFIDIPVLAVYPYGGVINVTLRANMKTGEKPYLINIDVKDIDLQQLIQDTKLKDKKIKGSFAAKSVLNGYLDRKDSLYGNGWLQISDGYLWEFPVMRGITDVIFMIPPEYVTLTDAFGNFSVKNNRIYTEDFKLLSKAASFLWVGSLGFDTTLDFGVTGRFAEDIIKKTTEPGRIASAILHEAGNLIMEIRLTGTLAKPKYQLVPFPIKKIFQENVVGKFKDIFGGVF
ncbi:MAG: hypothetical protein ABH843_05950 [Candidatus Omnitrophota bacterium]